MFNDYILPMIVNALSYVASIILFSNFLGRKENVRIIVLIIAAPFFSVMMLLLNSFHIAWVNTVSCFALFFIVAMVFFKGNHISSFILSIILTAIGATSELSVTLAVFSFSEIKRITLINVSEMANTRLTQFFSVYNSTGLFGVLICIMIVMALVKFFPRKLFSFGKRDFPAVMFPISALFVALFMLYITSGTVIPTSQYIFMLISQIALLLSSVFVFFIYAKIVEDYAVKEKNRLLENQIGYYQHQFDQIKTSQAVIGRIEHDIEKHLLALKLDLKNAMPLEAERKIDLLIGNLHLAKDAADSGNADIDAVLNYKAKQAAEFGIRMDCDLRLPYTMHMNTTDLSVILGNAIDNAIEACKAAEPTKRVICVSIIYEKPNLTYEVCKSADRRNQDGRRRRAYHDKAGRQARYRAEKHTRYGGKVRWAHGYSNGEQAVRPKNPAV